MSAASGRCSRPADKFGGMSAGEQNYLGESVGDGRPWALEHTFDHCNKYTIVPLIVAEFGITSTLLSVPFPE